MLDYKKIGLYLLEKRKLYQLTQKQLADQLNISFFCNHNFVNKSIYSQLDYGQCI